MEKEICCICTLPAIWFYMPGKEGESEYCDEHVPRGCSCNLEIDLKGSEGYSLSLPENLEGILVHENGTWEFLDEKGRRFPCIEYFYEE